MKTIYDIRKDKADARSRQREFFPDIESEPDFWPMYEAAKPFSSLAVVGFFNIYASVKYIAARGIPGDIVECGVLFGGASIMAALARDFFGIPDRKVYLYDTFAGFPEGSSDFIKARGLVKGNPMENFQKDVEENIAHVGIRAGSYELVAGPVEETLYGDRVPEQIALLRLDTDFYASTKVEFETLYPRLVQHGVLIVDDYGTWDGSRRATDEALADAPLLLHRVGHSIRSAIKV